MSVAIPSLRAAIAVPPWGKNELWRLARAVPSLDLRFAGNKSLVDAVTGASLITFTRASSGTYVDSAGVIQTAATDVPRFDHNPTTGESLGLLVEEQRTNSIRNNTMVGAVAGTPGTLPTNWPFQTSTNGLAVSIAGTGTELGITYLDWKISGTTTALATADICLERTAALTGQTWTSSVYVKLVSGSLSAVTTTFVRIVEEDASTNFIVGGSGAITLPTTASLGTQRGSFTRTLSGGATTAFIRTNLAVTVSSGSTVDFTLRIGLPQLEQGAFATSVIPTTAAAATRSADVASIGGSAFTSFYNQSEGTVFANFSAVEGPSEAVGHSFAISDNTINNRLAFFVTGPLNANYRLVSGGTSFNPGSNSAGSRVNIRAAITGKVGTDQGVGCVNGSLSASSSPASMPLVDRMYIAASHGGQEQSAVRIRRLVYWPTRFASTTLEAITRP